jgi:hypothetical protein
MRWRIRKVGRYWELHRLTRYGWCWRLTTSHWAVAARVATGDRSYDKDLPAGLPDWALWP